LTPRFVDAEVCRCRNVVEVEILSTPRFFLHAEATGPVDGAEASTSLQSHAGMPATAGEKLRELMGAAPRPYRKTCDAANQGSWENQLSCRNQRIHEYEEFWELPPARRLNLVRECGLCRLCLSHCDPDDECEKCP
jgi:hypothetical protein